MTENSTVIPVLIIMATIAAIASTSAVIVACAILSIVRGFRETLARTMQASEGAERAAIKALNSTQDLTVEGGPDDIHMDFNPIPPESDDPSKPDVDSSEVVADIISENDKEVF